MHPERRLRQDKHHRGRHMRRQKPYLENGSLVRRTPRGAPIGTCLNHTRRRSSPECLSRYNTAIISLAYDKSQKVDRSLPAVLRLIMESVWMMGLGKSEGKSDSLWAA